MFPKQHFLTHYPRIIKEIGPVINNWCMRMEAKHSFFTRIADSTKNFVNITKTLATAHQKHILDAGFSYADSYQSSKRRKKLNMDIIEKVETANINLEETFSIDFFSYNSIEYRVGLILIDESHFYEILHIFSNNHDYWFVCLRLKAYTVNRFLHSFEIEPSLAMLNNSLRKFLWVRNHNLNNTLE